MSNTNVPIYDPNRGFRVWSKSEIYTNEGEGAYVPNINDIVVDISLGFFRVVDVDKSTGLSTLEPWKPDTSEEQDGGLIGLDIGTQAESFRVYIDSTVIPHVLACDARLRVYGSSCSHVKLFRGTDVSDKGDVISAIYNSSGDFVGENIPLELVAMENGTNIAVKTPTTAYTNRTLEDGEVVTAVVYDDTGIALSFNSLLVKNTSFVRSTDADTKYISSVRLTSPYLDTSDERVLMFPTNMALEDFPAQVIVTYNDGSTRTLPINDPQVQLSGLDQFISSTSGQRVPLVLFYFLGDEEYAYEANNSGVVTHISEKYWAVTTEFEESYSIKIFAFPEWVSETQGYKLNFFLTNLGRNKIYNVTNLVELTNMSDDFNPFAYGVKQSLSYSVNMGDVDPMYRSYRFVQPFNLTLKAVGTSINTRWVVNFTNSQQTPYGFDIIAKVNVVNANLSNLDISCGAGSFEDWLRKTYLLSEPLLIEGVEVQPPLPNVLLVKTKLREYEVLSTDWDKLINITSTMSTGDNIVIELINRTVENDLKLGVVCLPVTVN